MLLDVSICISHFCKEKNNGHESRKKQKSLDCYKKNFSWNDFAATNKILTEKFRKFTTYKQYTTINFFGIECKQHSQNGSLLEKDTN